MSIYYDAMRIMRKVTWLFSLFICLLFSCNKEDSDIEESRYINVNAKEVLIDIVDIYNCHLVKDRYADFQVVAGNGNIVNTYLVESDGNTYLGFKPVLLIDSQGANMDTIKLFSKVYLGCETIAVVESMFRLDSVHSMGSYSSLYYTNTENKVSCQLAESPVRLLVGADGSYREEGQAKFCVVFNFPSAKIQPTDLVDYSVTISGFMGQNIEPIQKGLMVVGSSNSTQSVVLAIEGIVHNYYDVKGRLQEPYDIVYEIVSPQLFGNSEKQILQVTNSGDCYSNRIQACSLNGQQLDLITVVAQNFFGGEYINLTIE